MMVISLKFISFLIFLLTCIPTVANDKIKFAGFGSIGTVYSDSDDIGFRTDISKSDGVFKSALDWSELSRLGFQVEGNFSDDLSIVSQFVLTEQSAHSFDDAMRIMFLRYAPSAEWSIHLGRFAPDLFLLSEFRDVDMAYPWTNPPIEVYGIIPYRSFDGLDLSYSHRFDDWFFRGRVFIAEATANIMNSQIDLENAYGFALELEGDDYSVALRHTRADAVWQNEEEALLISGLQSVPPSLWPNASSYIDKISLNHENTHYTSLSGQYYFDHWTLQSEIARIESDATIIPTNISGYINLTRHWDEHQLFTTLGFSSSDNFEFNDLVIQPKLLSELIENIDYLMNLLVTDQNSISIGWRWNFRPNMSSTLQWDRVDVKAGSAGLWVGQTPEFPGEVVNVVKFSLGFTF